MNVFIILDGGGATGSYRTDYNLQLKNVKNTCDYVELCKKLNCQRFIYAGSINQVEANETLSSDPSAGSPNFIYGISKLIANYMGEVLAKQYDIDFITVMITNIFGENDNPLRLLCQTAKKLLKKEHCSFTAGTQPYDFIYMDDAVNQIIAVGQKGIPFKEYYIGSGNIRPLKEYLIDLANYIDSDADLGFGEILSNTKPLDYSKFDIDAVKKDTGYQNQFTFLEGIEKTMNWYKEVFCDSAV